MDTPAVVESTDSDVEPRRANLAALFRRLNTAYPDLYIPSETELAPLEDELERARKRERTSAYIVACTAAIAMLAAVPILLVRGYRVVRSLEPIVGRFLRHPAYLDANPELAVAGIFAAAGAIFYTLVMHQRPLMRIAGAFARRRARSLTDIERSAWQFILFAGIVNYAAIGTGLVFLCSYSQPDGALQRWALTAWLYLPVPLLSLLPPILLTVVLALVFGRHDLYDDAPQAAILRAILLLLDDLRAVTASRDVSSSQRRTLMRSVAGVAKMLRAFYARRQPRNSAEGWAVQRMNVAADGFLILSSWIAFPKEDTFVQLKGKIVTYANTVAAGTYDGLLSTSLGPPEGLVMESRRKTAWRKAGGLLGTFVLVSIPLAAYSVIVSSFKFDVPTGLNSAAGVVYSGWIVLCLLAYMDDLAPDAKATMLDVIRLVFRR